MFEELHMRGSVTGQRGDDLISKSGRASWGRSSIRLLQPIKQSLQLLQLAEYIFMRLIPCLWKTGDWSCDSMQNWRCISSSSQEAVYASWPQQLLTAGHTGQRLLLDIRLSDHSSLQARVDDLGSKDMWRWHSWSFSLCDTGYIRQVEQVIIYGTNTKPKWNFIRNIQTTGETSTVWHSDMQINIKLTSSN